LLALLEAVHLRRHAWKTQARIFLRITVPALALSLAWNVIALIDIPAWRAGSGGGSESVALLKLYLLIVHPVQFARAVVGTLADGTELWKELIGVFGWLDVAMPGWTYPMLSILVLA